MSTSSDLRELALQAYQELIGASSPDLLPHGAVIQQPSLENVLADAAPLPQDALFLGIAVDGLPVLLDLRDAAPGPLLVTADSGAGKTAFLKMVARAASILYEPNEIEFAVLTHRPEEWQSLAGLPQCVGVYAIQDVAAHEFLSSLNTWARHKRNTDASILVLLDDLARVETLPLESRQTLRWLLVRGPNHGIWTLATLQPDQAEQVLPWLDAFRTRILGNIEDEEEVELLAGVAGNISLEEGQFALREGRGWLKFWIPNLDE